MTHPLHRLGFKNNYARNSAAKCLLFEDAGFWGALDQRKTPSENYGEELCVAVDPLPRPGFETEQELGCAGPRRQKMARV